MFTEILKIIPRLSRADAANMEQSLSTRFSRVAKRFGSGLRAVIKGSILGISLGLLSRLLNPLEAVEERIKKLLGEGNDLADLADRLGTSPGKLKRLQDQAEAKGLDQGQFREILTKFAEAVETARKEFEDPTIVPSPASRAVKNFTGKDIAQNFADFIQALKGIGEGPGRDVFFSEREQRRAAEREANHQTISQDELEDLRAKGLSKQRTGLQVRQGIEEAVFGAIQHGAGRHLIEDNPAETFKKLGEPSAERLDKVIHKVAGLADQQRVSEVKRNTESFLTASKNVDGETIRRMENSAKVEEARLDAQIQSYKDMRSAADGIESIKQMLMTLSGFALKIVGYLGNLVESTRKWENSPLFKYLPKWK